MASTTNEVERSRNGATSAAERRGNLARITSLVGSPIMTRSLLWICGFFGCGAECSVLGERRRGPQADDRDTVPARPVIRACRRRHAPLLTGLAFALSLGGPALAEIAGTPRIIDGRTLEVAGQRVTLFGIDAPDVEQVCQHGGRDYQCGKVARAALWDLVAGLDVSCTPEAEAPAPDGSIAATCTAGGSSLNENMVYTGWALAERAATAAKGRDGCHRRSCRTRKSPGRGAAGAQSRLITVESVTAQSAASVNTAAAAWAYSHCRRSSCQSAGATVPSLVAWLAG